MGSALFGLRKEGPIYQIPRRYGVVPGDIFHIRLLKHKLHLSTNGPLHQVNPDSDLPQWPKSYCNQILSPNSRHTWTTLEAVPYCATCQGVNLLNEAIERQVLKPQRLFQYNKGGMTLFMCWADNLLDADEKFTLDTGVDPVKDVQIGVAIGGWAK